MTDPLVTGSFALSAEVIATSSGIRGVFTVPPSFTYLRGHMPDAPVVPGMVIVDIVDRLSRLLVGINEPAREIILARFRTPLLPDETLQLDCAVVPGRPQVEALGNLDGRPMCHVILEYAIEEATTCC